MADESTNEFAQLEITEVIEKLGGLREEFRPQPGNLIVGIIVGTICVLLGVSIDVYFLTLRQVRDEASMVLAGIGALFMVSGTIAIVTSNRRRRYRMLICAKGFATCTAAESRPRGGKRFKELKSPKKDHANFRCTQTAKLRGSSSEQTVELTLTNNR